MAKRGGGFPGLGGGGNMQQMIKQAQKMQQEMQERQEELDGKEFSATSGGGVVSVTVTGKKEIIDLTIDPEAVDPEDVEMLQDLIIAAVNEAIRNAEDTVNKEMSALTGGMNLGL